MRTIITFLMIAFLLSLTTPSVQALTEEEVMRATHIINLEAQPIWFRPGQPIDFIVTIKYDGGTQDGFDIGVFHEGRLVGWEMNKRLNRGENTFKLQDRNFRGDPGGYIVKVKFKGKEFLQKRFTTRTHCPVVYYTINPTAPPPKP
ncbi:MAG: hypothetical protein ABIL70_09745 [candidate division WOR-3 bacterium]